MAKKRKIHVPFTRELKKGMRGRDVKAVKRALVDQGVLDQKLKNVSDRFGPATKTAVNKWKKSHGLSANGIYTRSMHNSLVRGKHFDKHGAMLMNAYHSRPKSPKGNGKAVAAAALFAHSHRPRHYTQGSSRWQPVSMVPWQKHMWSYGDCSSFATGCYRMAGLPDPNGLNYTAGYTGTLCRHGRRVSSPEPGDLIFYGSGAPWHHVAVYVGGGNVVSHGYEGGPYLVPYRYRSDFGEIRRYV